MRLPLASISAISEGLTCSLGCSSHVSSPNDVPSHEMQNKTWEVSGGHRLRIWSWCGKKKDFRGWRKWKSGGQSVLASGQILGGQNPSVKIPRDILGCCISSFAELICGLFSPLAEHSSYLLILFQSFSCKTFPNHKTETECLFFLFVWQP